MSLPPLICVCHLQSTALDMRALENMERKFINGLTPPDDHTWWIRSDLITLIKCHSPRVYECHSSVGYGVVHPVSVPWIEHVMQARPPKTNLEDALHALVMELRYNPDAGRKTREHIQHYERVWKRE